MGGGRAFVLVLLLLLARAELDQIRAEKQIGANDPDKADPALGLEAGKGTVQVVDQV